MATTTKSTKAKTKTAAARTTKSSAKRTKAKAATTKAAATKKAATKKVAAKKSVITKSTNAKTTNSKKPTRTSRTAVAGRFKSFKLARSVTLRTLRGLHLITAGLLVLLALAAGYFMDNTSYQLTIGHIAKDELTSTTEAVLVPAVQAVYDVELRWLVIATLVVSAILPILYLTKLTNRYSAYLKETRMLPLRWIDFAVTGALIVETTALVNGASDLPTLKLLAGLVIATALIGLIAERQNNEVATPVRSAYLTSLFTGLLPLLFIAVYMTATAVYGTTQLPWYAYALFAVVLFQYVAWMRNMRMHLRGANNLIIERNYLAISLLTKAAFAIVLIAGFFR